VLEATTALSKHIQEPDLRSQVSQALHPLVDSIPAKFKLISLDHTSNTHGLPGLPVLTRSPLVLLVEHFKRIPLALQEVGSMFLTTGLDSNDYRSMQVSRWLDPLVDYQVSFSKSSNSPYTQIAIDAVKCYGCLSKDCPADELVRPVFYQ
jgi:hypothetical protein